MARVLSGKSLFAGFFRTWSWRIAEQRSILAHLKQVQPLLTGRALQLQHQFAAKTDFFLGDGDGIPGEAAPLRLLNAGLGIFEFELRQVFFCSSCMSARVWRNSF